MDFRARPRVHGRVSSSFVLVLLLPLLLCGAAPQTAPPRTAPQTAADPCDPVPSPPQWTTINLDYSSQRYVDLDQITPKNVKQLTKICELQLNSASWFSSGLLMVDRTIYVNTVHSTYALDAVTCEQQWRYDIPLTSFIATISNRGSAYLDGMLYRGTADGRVIALETKPNMKWDRLRWQTQAADPSRNESFTAAPVAWNGKVFIGIVTADLGVRGRVMAFDATTGKELWRFNTIPLGTELGADTWPSALVTGGVAPAGGAFWTSFSLDPDTGELFGPVSNPNPDYVRLGAEELLSLYTNSLISLDATTGALKWFTQTIAGDDHDWDLGTQPSLYLTKSGKKMLAVAGKEGFVIGIDRGSPSIKTPYGANKKIAFKTAGTTQSSVLLHSGKDVPPKDPFPPPNDAHLRLVCPGTIGGAEWNGTAYQPCTGTLFSGMVDFCFYYSTSYWGGDPGGFWTNKEGGIVRAEFSKPPSGHITAMDGETGTVLWRYPPPPDPANPVDPKKKMPVLAPVLTGLVPTKSGLLFAGDVRGNLLALDARSGKPLNQIDAGGALNHGLISYAVNGRQYVAAAVGGITLNAVGVSGPLRVSIYGLPSGKPADVQVSKSRVPIPWSAPPKGTPPPAQAVIEAAESFVMICQTCHGPGGTGGEAPPLLRHTELVNDPGNKGKYQVLKDFLAGVPPPMPVLYPGLLEEDEVEAIGLYLKYVVFNPKNPQLANSAPVGYVYQQPKSGGTKEWQAIYSVLTHPRCINCHTTTTYPRQRDIRYPHIYAITRGTDDQGALVARCQDCHGTTNNNEPGRGIPGAPGPPNWQLAPLSMAWESAPGIPMTGPELCAMLKNPLLNGNRTLEGLLDHLDTGLVKWAWNPGKRWNGDDRTTPPGTHDGFVKTFTAWVNDKAPCPEG